MFTGVLDLTMEAACSSETSVNITKSHVATSQKTQILPCPLPRYSSLMCEVSFPFCSMTGARGSVVVEELCYKPEGRGIASR
jgi:hypothetical protein